MNLAAERIESVKAGSLGATATTIAFVCFALVPVQPIAVPLLLIRGAIALVTGFLFGVTYRYIVRQDNNSHLRQGAVLAFGLVRGLAQVEGATLAQPLPAGVAVVESVGMIAIAAFGIEMAMRRGWLKPFGA
ncbi:hypothetical protein IFO70_12030 [Phormidium tenue FACHB-886]|nr:hypothetical protein [Phormidium tenue FACHB-886]